MKLINSISQIEFNSDRNENSSVDYISLNSAPKKDLQKERCIECYRKFASKSSLRSHLWMVHDVDYDSEEMKQYISRRMKKQILKIRREKDINLDNNRRLREKLNLMLSEDSFEIFRINEIFNIDFKIEDISIELSDKNENDQLTPIINFHVSDIDINTLKRQYDTKISASLGKLFIIDNIQKGLSEDLTYFMKSRGDNKSDALFLIDISLVQLGSPLYESVGTDIDIKARFGTLDCIFIFYNSIYS